LILASWFSLHHSQFTNHNLWWQSCLWFYVNQLHTLQSLRLSSCSQFALLLFTTSHFATEFVWDSLLHTSNLVGTVVFAITPSQDMVQFRYSFFRFHIRFMANACFLIYFWTFYVLFWFVLLCTYIVECDWWLCYFVSPISFLTLLVLTHKPW
jgi:hypothetical protein